MASPVPSVFTVGAVLWYRRPTVADGVSTTQKSVKDFYQASGRKEWRRLARTPFNRLEFDTTFRFLRHHLPPSGRVLDAGGGPGRYTIELARLGYRVVLLDLVAAQLDIARRQIAQARVAVEAIEEGSIVDLARYPDESFDAVVCLGGPLSHVERAADRAKAVKELTRVARRSATVAVSVMGRLAVLAASPQEWPKWIAATELFDEAWRTGDDRAWCGTSFAHFFLPEELDALMAQTSLQVVERVGLEGLGSPSSRAVNRLARRDPEAWANWLRAHDGLCTHPAVYATSGHMLFIARKP